MLTDQRPVGPDRDRYTYVPSYTGIINIISFNALNNITDDDIYAKVYNGSCGPMACVGSNDDMAQNYCQNYVFATRFNVPVTSGRTYYIVWSNVRP